MIEIMAPTALLSDGGIWDSSTWTRLDVDRIDFSVNNDVNVYEQPDEETSLSQLAASMHQITITGYINDNSALVGTGSFEKMKNLILAGREWYVGLGAEGSGFPQVRWENLTYDFLIQKLMIIDDFNGEDINYQLALVLAHT